MKKNYKYKISEKYQVPLPETCEKLNWKEQTNFCWFFDNAVKEWYLFTFEDCVLNGIVNYVYAPQLHEVLAHIKSEGKSNYYGGLETCVSYNAIFSVKIPAYYDTIEEKYIADEVDTCTTISFEEDGEEKYETYTLITETLVKILFFK